MAAGNASGRWAPLVDTHAHIFLRDLPLVAGATHRPEHDFTTEDYLRLLDAEGVAYGVIAAPSFLGTYNDYMTAELCRHRRLRGTAILDPATDPYTLRAMDAEGVVGIRFSLRRYAEVPDLAAPDWQRLLRRVRDLDWHVHILAEPARLLAMLPVLVASGINLVIDHFGHPSTRDGVGCATFEAVLHALGNGRTWLKLSGPYRTPGLDAKAIAATALRVAGTERLLWGSDCPWTAFEGRFTYRDTIAWFEEWVPDRAQRDAIGQTALRLYKFA
jgi:predicted TIM-barrel fold metal-dependent hydrolase